MGHPALVWGKSNRRSLHTALRSGRDDNSVGPLTAIRLTAFGIISLQLNCHPDRSEA